MRYAIVAVLALCLAACETGKHPQQYNAAAVQAALGVDVGAGELKDVWLQDGTRCVVFFGPFKGAVSCDWTGPKMPPPAASAK